MNAKQRRTLWRAVIRAVDHARDEDFTGEAMPPPPVAPRIRRSAAFGRLFTAEYQARVQHEAHTGDWEQSVYERAARRGRRGR